MPEPDRVMMILQTLRKSGFDQLPATGADYLDWKHQSHSFENMSAAFAIPEYGLNISGSGEPERVTAAMRSKEFLSVLRINPVVGRNCLPEEDSPSGAPAVIISHALWQRRFHADPLAVGQTLTVNGIPRAIVGVVPHEVSGMVAADLWLPTQINPNGNERKNHTYGIVARLKPGVTMEQARAEMAMIGQRLEQQYPATNSGWGVRVFPMAEMYSGKIRPVLLGAVALLLLIACANLANLLLARAAARQKEIGVMGAGRMRIVRQLMTESLVLAFAGGLVGLMLAAASVRLLRGVIPDMFPTMKQMTFDGRVLLFTFGICILTCLLFGLVPESFACGAEHHRPKRQTGGRTAWEDRNEFAGRCWHRRWRWRCCFQ